MASVLTVWPAEVRMPNYGYDRYLDGQVWTVRPGVDCPDRDTKSLLTGFRFAAKRLGKKVRGKQLPNGAIAVQAYEKE